MTAKIFDFEAAKKKRDLEYEKQERKEFDQWDTMGNWNNFFDQTPMTVTPEQLTKMFQDVEDTMAAVFQENLDKLVGEDEDYDEDEQDATWDDVEESLEAVMVESDALIQESEELLKSLDDFLEDSKDVDDSN